MGLGPHVIDWAVVSCGGDEEARYRVRRFAYRRARRFAFSAPEVQRTIRMTCGPGPPCHRLGYLDLGAHRA
jgi:phage-related protein